MNVSIKTQWSDVTVNEYMRLVELNERDSELFDEQLQTLAILTELSYNELQDLTVQQVKKLIAKTGFLAERPDGDLKYEFELDGDKYVPQLQVGDFTSGRFIDIMSLTQDEDKIIENLHMIVGAILNPVEERWYWTDKVGDYGDEPLQDTADKVLHHMNIEDALALALFFYRVYVSFYQTIQDSLEDEVKKKKMKKTNPLTMMENKQ